VGGWFVMPANCSSAVMNAAGRWRATLDEKESRKHRMGVFIIFTIIFIITFDYLITLINQKGDVSTPTVLSLMSYSIEIEEKCNTGYLILGILL